MLLCLHYAKISASEKEAIETAIKDVKDVMDGDDLDAINNKTESLMNASMKLGEAMYKATQEQATASEGATAETSEKKEDDNVVDADFEEVKK